MSRLSILNVPIDHTSYTDVVARATEWMSGDVCRLVFTPNPEMVVAAQKNPAFMSAMQSSDLNPPDGSGLILAARLRGVKLNRVTGVDAAEYLIAAAAKNNWRIYLLGGGRGVAAAAATKLSTHYKGLDITISDLGFLVDRVGSSSQTNQVLADISAHRSHLLLVALGAPKQELWLTQNRAALSRAGVKVAMGIGGAFDYWAGTARRAPKAIRSLGLEWLWRLFTQPRRLGRILRATFVFMLLNARQKTSRF
jgi:N-acetylglucosaminyldiphosphoundecaprenol N-acetyl-beta-D-mannosaminyltransferase